MTPTKSQHTLSLCMIVKNEAQVLGQCLDSVIDLADEIVLMDTGSEDETIDIGKRHGARIHSIPWENDFSSARNASLEKANMEWILVLDADEVVAPVDHGRIRDLLKKDAAYGFALEQRTYGNNPNFKNWIPACEEYPEERGYSGYIASALIRLFRRDIRIRFTGPVHELVEPSFSIHSLPYESTAIPIHHYGKVRDPSRIDRKARLYLEIGQIKAEADPGPKAWTDLASQYLELEDYEKAAETYRKVVEQCPGRPDPFVDLGVTYLRHRKLKAAESELLKALDLNPDHTDGLFNLGTVYLHQKRYAAAENIFYRLIDLQPAFGNAYGALGSILLCLNRIEEAVPFLVEATKYNKADADLYSNLAWAYVQLGWRQQALISCDRAIALNSDHKNASLLKEKALKMDPREAERAAASELNLRGETLFRESKTEEAELYFQKAIRVDPQCSEALNNLGVICWENRRAGSALAYFLRAFFLSPQHPNVRANLFDCCDGTGKHRIKKLLAN